jgi:outer membrane protein OmpA-like peptidoglycan-associated protein
MEIQVRNGVFGVLLLALTGCSSMSSGPPPSTFIIFFYANSTDLLSDAATEIGRAAAAIKNVHPRTAAIAAGGASGSNLLLAEPRYLAVRQALIGKGVSSSLIAEASLPKEGIQITETANQRVEIILAPDRAH